MLMLVCIFGALSLVNSVLYGIALAKITHVAHENRALACVQKAKAQREVMRIADYLAKNPGREPIPGVTRETLITDLADARDYRDSFGGLDCG
jgi:hypothetical protein